MLTPWCFLEFQWLNNKHGLPVIDVVLDPYLCINLRPHQIKGVTFLYKCVMGMGDFNGNGAILAYVFLFRINVLLKYNAIP